MRLLFFLLLVLACGKEPGKSSRAQSLTSDIPSGFVSELVDMRCDWKKDCQAICISEHILCDDLCFENTEKASPEENACTWDCRHEYDECAKKTIKVTQEEYQEAVN